MVQLKRATNEEPDPHVEEALDVNNDLDEPDIVFLDRDDDVKYSSDGLDDSTPCFVKRCHFLTDNEK